MLCMTMYGEMSEDNSLSPLCCCNIHSKWMSSVIEDVTISMCAWICHFIARCFNSPEYVQFSMPVFASCINVFCCITYDYFGL